MSRPAESLDELSHEERRELLLRLLEEEQSEPDVAPLSSAQARLWFLDQLVPLSPLYNVTLAFEIRGPLDRGALERSLHAVTDRHEILRTAFESVGGRPQQVVAERVSLPLPLVDLAALPAAARKAETRRLTRAAARRPFHLDRCPLVRARLLCLGPEYHQLVLTLHHILADGWSMGVLYRDLAELYRAATAGRPLPRALPELPIQYADYALWQREWLASEEQRRQLAYWCEHLAGAPARLPLPSDRRRPSRERFRGAQHTFTFGRELTASLEALSRRYGLTLFMTLLAGFAALLRRISGEDDLVLGTPIANRHRQEVEPLIGLFVNTLALRLRPHGAAPFHGLLRQAEQVALGAYAHQDLPFERLIETLRPERSLSHNPLCQVLFALQNYPAEPLALGELELEPLAETALDTGTSKFDLTLYLWQVDGELSGLFEYNVDLFDAATVARLGEQLEPLLHGAAADPATAVDHLPLFPPAARRQLLEAWNPPCDQAPSLDLAERFRAVAHRRGEAPALRFADGDLSYRQLLERSETLARRLRALGVGPEGPVGLALERSAAMVVGMVGVALAGGVYVPLDPSYPPERLAFLAADAGLGVVICEPRTPAGIASAGRVRVELAAGGDLLGEAPAHPGRAEPWSPAAPEQAAYIIYTSGSTGAPKGVVVSQRSILGLVLGADYVQLQPDDVVAQASNANFDAATWEVWGALLNGALLLGIPREVTLEPAEMAAVLRRERVTALFLTTALFHQLAATDPHAFSGLRHLLFGGERVDVDKVRRVLDAGPPRRLLHVYGPTECTTFAAWHPVRELPPEAPTVAIGGPVCGARLQVVDRALEPVPPGVPGELWIGGQGLARGYLGQPARTAMAFVPDPFAGPAQPGARLYRTGDGVRRRGDGALLFLGRDDQQVKIRGFRVEPGEIEHQLRQHPEVDEAVVLARESSTADGTRDRRLVAFVASGEEPRDLSTSAAESESLEAWREVYDSAIYQDLGDGGADPGRDHPDRDLAGWTSSFTGEPIPEAELREQVEGTVARLRGLQPSRVLEIGCGTGLLLVPLAPECRRYWGTDFSRVALDFLERRLAADPVPGARLFPAAAHDLAAVDAALAELGEDSSFDLVVLNSVVQYFPNAAYLETVIRAALERLAPGGSIFLGDLRFRPVLPLLAGALELFRAPGELDRSHLRARVAATVAAEGELVLGPAFFHRLGRRLPELAGIEIRPKRGRGDNELARFRADVVLRRGGLATGAEQAEATPKREPWPEGWSLGDLRHHLQASSDETWLFAGVPNARLAKEVHLQRWLDEAVDPTTGAGAATVAGLRRELETGGPTTGIDPEALWRLADQIPWNLDLCWERGDPEGRFDLLAWPRGTPVPRRPLLAAEGPAASDPTAARRRRRLGPRLRRFTSDRLPAHLVPAAFVVLDTLPLNPNGKIDHTALAAVEELFDDGPTRGREDFVPPRTPAEKGLARIWSEVLGISPVSAHDDFFELGGHSLLATQVASRIRSTFRVEMPLATLFETPVLSALAERLTERLTEMLAAMDEDEALALLTALEGSEEATHGV